MIWGALIIPLVAAGFVWHYYKTKIVWWEVILPSAIAAVLIIIFKYASIAALTSDVEYHGALITKARYYEYWETWEHRTCYRSQSCGKNCTVQVPYDCSYCDHNSEYWEAYDTDGNKWRISEAKYNELMKRWNASPQFVELNRDIRNHFSCGKDGDAYEIAWDGSWLTSEPSSFEQSYTNKVQASKNAFSYPEISKEKARELGLYEYPKIYNKYLQHAVLGLDSLSIERVVNQKLMMYFNGKYGVENHIKVYTLLFFNQPVARGFEQEAYWAGGNRNEVVICIDVDKNTHKLNWVKVFSWCKDKRVHVDIREELMEGKTLDFPRLYDILVKFTLPHYTPRDFKDFDYINVPVPTWAIIVTYLAVLIASGLCLRWAVLNEFEDETEKFKRSSQQRW